MLRANGVAMEEGYTYGRILKRTLHTARRRFSLDLALASFFTQLGLKKAYGELYSRALGRP